MLKQIKRDQSNWKDIFYNLNSGTLNVIKINAVFTFSSRCSIQIALSGEKTLQDIQVVIGEFIWSSKEKSTPSPSTLTLLNPPTNIKVQMNTNQCCLGKSATAKRQVTLILYGVK